MELEDDYDDYNENPYAGLTEEEFLTIQQEYVQSLLNDILNEIESYNDNSLNFRDFLKIVTPYGDIRELLKVVISNNCYHFLIQQKLAETQEEFEKLLANLNEKVLNSTVAIPLLGIIQVCPQVYDECEDWEGTAELTPNQIEANSMFIDGYDPNEHLATIQRNYDRIWGLPLFNAMIALSDQFIPESYGIHIHIWGQNTVAGEKISDEGITEEQLDQIIKTLNLIGKKLISH